MESTISHWFKSVMANRHSHFSLCPAFHEGCQRICSKKGGGSNEQGIIATAGLSNDSTLRNITTNLLTNFLLLYWKIYLVEVKQALALFFLHLLWVDHGIWGFKHLVRTPSTTGSDLELKSRTWFLWNQEIFPLKPDLSRWKFLYITKFIKSWKKLNFQG